MIKSCFHCGNILIHKSWNMKIVLITIVLEARFHSNGKHIFIVLESSYYRWVV
ncbi:MAG: hypothetical protein LKF70_05265 [Prevotella sp.]|jgi:hypothetical protein|nr:hypothetical protein [Prevotella sp.]MCH4241527.1 hypothetical protein [Prevotella sp.]